MPNLAAVLPRSASGNLETLHPPLSPLVWTTMMTGVDPVRHGILDFLHLRPDTGDREPITSTERRVPALWNMATWAGKRVAVFGLWATYPAEPVNGLMVSDRMFTFLYGEDAPPPGAVFPPDREQWAREIADRAGATIDFERVKQFLPTLTRRSTSRRPWTRIPTVTRWRRCGASCWRRASTPTSHSTGFAASTLTSPSCTSRARIRSATCSRLSYRRGNPRCRPRTTRGTRTCRGSTFT